VRHANQDIHLMGVGAVRSCLAGKRQLYDYCAAHGVPHRRLGKLVVATSDDQVAGLHALRRRAIANGVDDTVLLTPAEVARLEPAVRCVAALSSPSTGIIDSHALMLAYQGDAEAAGAMVVFRAPVEGGRVTDDGFALSVGGAEPMELACRYLVNSAGLYAPSLARRIAGIPAASIPRDYLCRGVYFTLTGRAHGSWSAAISKMTSSSGESPVISKSTQRIFVGIACLSII